MKVIFLFLINVYRKYLSGLKRTPSCRFYPTCSAYAYEAVREWGALIGLLLGLWRILRCNPLVHGGVDHVPLRGSKKRSAAGYTVFYARSPFDDPKKNTDEGKRGKSAKRRFVCGKTD